MLICDSPAKSFALNIKSHTSYFSCTKCDQEGKFFNNLLIMYCALLRLKIYASDYLCKRDIHSSFKSVTQSECHIDRSIIYNLNNYK